MTKTIYTFGQHLDWLTAAPGRKLQSGCITLAINSAGNLINIGHERPVVPHLCDFDRKWTRIEPWRECTPGEAIDAALAGKDVRRSWGGDKIKTVTVITNVHGEHTICDENGDIMTIMKGHDLIWEIRGE